MPSPKYRSYILHNAHPASYTVSLYHAYRLISMHRGRKIPHAKKSHRQPPGTARIGLAPALIAPLGKYHYPETASSHGEPILRHRNRRSRSYLRTGTSCKSPHDTDLHSGSPIPKLRQTSLPDFRIPIATAPIPFPLSSRILYRKDTDTSLPAPILYRRETDTSSRVHRKAPLFHTSCETIHIQLSMYGLHCCGRWGHPPVRAVLSSDKT